MNKTLSASLFAMGVLLLASCGSGGAKKEANAGACAGAQPSLRLESYNYDCLGEFDEPLDSAVEASKYVRFQGSGVLPVADGEQGLTQLRDSLLKLAGVHFNDSDEPVPDDREDIKLTDKAGNSVDAPSEVLSNLTVALVNPQVAVFRQNSYLYQAGAAHGNTSVSYVNYSVSDGKILSVSDFVAPENQPKLRGMIADKLKADEVPLLVKPAEVPVPDDFEITCSGLAFSFNPYEVAPYSAGVVSVELNTADLQQAGILTPAGYRLLTGETVSAK